MLFKVVLFAVIVYLTACYAYGVYLLFKLWSGRKLAQSSPAALAALPAGDQAGAATPAAEPMPRYATPAKAA
jgi:hypothetical protein